jgi:hypothetical protein
LTGRPHHTEMLRKEFFGKINAAERFLLSVAASTMRVTPQGDVAFVHNFFNIIRTIQVSGRTFYCAADIFIRHALGPGRKHGNAKAGIP